MNASLLVNRLTDVLKEGIHVVDQYGITVQYNRRIEIIENRTAADVLDRNLESLEKGNEMDELLIEVLATGLPKINVMHDCVNTYGNSISVNFSFWPIIERNVVKGAIKVASDMTEIRRLRAENIGLTKDISQMSRIENSLVKLTDGFRIEDIIGESPQMEAVKSQVINA
ncbi:MAG: PAS domain S-box protein, partial [Firmicutes bacterium]|nr:PAS domain S-box protein [Bacillota bacterium]